MSNRESYEASLTKIADIDKSGYQLNSVLAVNEDLTFNEIDGPLAGVPILIKDNIEALGLPATAGSLALADTPVARDSTIAKRLRAAASADSVAAASAAGANDAVADAFRRSEKNASEAKATYLRSFIAGTLAGRPRRPHPEGKIVWGSKTK